MTDEPHPPTGPDGATLADAIDARLPQVHCGRCGYGGCRPYAEAVASGEADINRCPPGGEHTINALAALLGRPPRPIDPDCGAPLPPQVAVIDEDSCIGCTLCIQACPVDAIMGAAKQMHTVIRDECTGCELCLDPCPVDCIRLEPAPDAADLSGAWPWPAERAARARRRFAARQQRLARRTAEQAGRQHAAWPDRATRQAYVAAARERARARRRDPGSYR